MGEVGEREPAADYPMQLCGFVPADAPPGLLRVQLLAGFRHAAALISAQSARVGESQRAHELHELARIGAANPTAKTGSQ